jgi:5'-nucleotidase
MAGSQRSKPHVLVSNDDGISAPGIVALVQALVSAEVCVSVSAPHIERSAMSQALSLGKALLVEQSDLHPDTQASYAVYGTPADSVMVALNSMEPHVRSVLSLGSLRYAACCAQLRPCQI